MFGAKGWSPVTMGAKPEEAAEDVAGGGGIDISLILYCDATSDMSLDISLNSCLATSKLTSG